MNKQTKADKPACEHVEGVEIDGLYSHKGKVYQVDSVEPGPGKRMWVYFHDYTTGEEIGCPLERFLSADQTERRLYQPEKRTK